jgi:hypothetical protein
LRWINRAAGSVPYLSSMSEAATYQHVAIPVTPPAARARRSSLWKTPAFPFLAFLLVSAMAVMGTMIFVGIERGILFRGILY